MFSVLLLLLHNLNKPHLIKKPNLQTVQPSLSLHLQVEWSMLKNPDKNSFFFIEREKSSLMHDTFMSINCIQHWLASSLRLSNKLSRAFHWTEDARQLFLGSFVAVRCLALHKLLQLVLQSFITKKNRFLLKKLSIRTKQETVCDGVLT